MKPGYVLAFFISIFLILVAFSYGKPFHGDEVVFPECAKGLISHGGAPIINYGILNSNYQCLWHPPLYISLLSLSSLVFGDNAIAYRLVSTIFIVLSSIVIYFLTNEIFKNNKRKKIIALIVCFIYLFNPLTVQSALITDIDGGLLTFFILLFLYLYIKSSGTIPLFLTLLMIFLSKESGPVILLPSLLIVLLLKKDFKKAIKVTGIFILAGALSVLLFWIYAHLLNLDFSMPFRHNFMSQISSLGFNMTSISKMGWVFKTFFYFAIPSFVLLFFISAGNLFYRALKVKQIDANLILFSLISLSVMGLFTLVGAGGWGFPKYFAPAIPLMSITMAGVLIPWIEKNKDSMIEFLQRNKVRLILLAVILTIYVVVLLGDPLIPEFDATARYANFALAIELIFKSFFLYIAIPFLLSLVVLKGNKKFLAALIFLTVFFYFYINLLQAAVPYSTSFKYGDSGVQDVLTFFKENNISSSSIATYPHIGYYMNMSNYYEIMFLYLDKDTFKTQVVDNPKIKYMVIYERDIDRIGSDGMGYFKLDRKIGTYYVYKKTVQ